jgi:Zn finger protein HypA/HybF involved in hydrogenase expression
MLAQAQIRNERTIEVSKITPAKAAPYLCSHCLRPMPEGKLEYICENCGANHYEGLFYICCPVDAERPL